MKSFFSMAFGLLVVIAPITAQIFAPNNQTSLQRSALLEHLEVARPDSNRAILLLDISEAYLEANLPDSALFYSSQAMALCQSLSMQEAFGQGCFLACRANGMKGDIAAAEVIIRETRGIWKMRMLQELSEHYSFRPGNLPSNLDSAWPYIRQAIALTDTMHLLTATQNVRAILAKFAYARGETQKGVDYFLQNIREWQLAGDKAQEAHWWSELGIYTPASAGTKSIILQANRNAVKLFLAAGKKKDAFYSLMDLAKWHWLLGQVQLAEQEQQQANDSLKALGHVRMYTNYRKLATYELCLGNHNLALQLMLKAKKNIDSLHEDFTAGNLDKHLADVYWAENDIDKSLYWYQASLLEIQGRRDLAIYGIALRIVQGLLVEKRVTEAEQFLVRFVAQNPPVRNMDKETIATGWGDIYVAQGQYKKAERYYLDMIGFNNLTIGDSKKDIEVYFDYDITRSEANYTIARFYVNQHQFAKARPFLLRSLDPQRLIPEPVDILRDDHLLLFKVDSAAGNLASAMEQRLLYEKYADSISTNAKAGR